MTFDELRERVRSIAETARAWAVAAGGNTPLAIIAGHLRDLADAAEPDVIVYCKHCPFSRHVHYMQDGKLVTPSCPGFEPDVPDQGEGH